MGGAGGVQLAGEVTPTEVLLLLQPLLAKHWQVWLWAWFDRWAKVALQVDPVDAILKVFPASCYCADGYATCRQYTCRASAVDYRQWVGRSRWRSAWSGNRNYSRRWSTECSRVWHYKCTWLLPTALVRFDYSLGLWMQRHRHWCCIAMCCL